MSLQSITSRSVVLLSLISGYKDNAFGQCPANTYINTQSQINQFATFYPSCDTIYGLNIGSDVTSLAGLSQVKVVKSNLLIKGSSLTNFQGLENLEVISGDLEVTENTSLEDFAGLNNLKKVRSFIVTKNANLRDFSGLYGLDSILQTFLVQENGSLLDFSGLGALKSIQTQGDWLSYPYYARGFQVAYNNQLKDFTGLTSLGYINKGLNVLRNDSLESLNGLEKLDSISSGGVHLSFNKKLKNVRALSNLKSCNEVHLNELPLLETLDGIENLTTIPDLSISNCASLASMPEFNKWYGGSGRIYFKNCPRIKSIDKFPVLQNCSRIEIDKLDSLESITQFSQLKSTWNGISIFNCANITTISGFSNLSSTSTLIISSNPKLYSISGFQSLRTISGELSLNMLQSLDTIGSFLQLDSIGGKLNISDNAQLKTIDAFPELRVVEMDIVLSNNRSLTSILNFDNLDTVRNGFYIQKDSQLVTLSGFNNMYVAGYAFQISSCPNLVSITGFDRGAHQILIGQNDNLQTIDAFHSAEGSRVVLFWKNKALTSLNIFKPQTIIGQLSIEECGSLLTIDLAHCVWTVLGDILIKNNKKLAHFAGPSVQSVSSVWPAGTIRIDKNDALVQIVGFQGLKRLHSLLVSNNLSLTHLNFTSELKRLYVFDALNNPVLDFNTTFLETDTIESLSLRNCHLLNDFSTFQTLKQCKYLTVDSCDNLTSLQGLPEVQFEIVNLHNLKGLQNLSGWRSKSARHLRLHNCDTLVNFYGLELLDSVTTEISIKDNDQLVSLEGLGNSQLKLANILIQSNPKLEYCAILPICMAAAASPQLLSISGNSSSCNSLTAISHQCTNNFNFITGRAYLDKNCNQQYDTGTDQPYAHLLLKNVQTSIPITQCDNLGNYQLFAAKQSALSYLPSPTAPYFQLHPTQYHFVFDSIVTYNLNKDFSLCPDTSKHDISMSATHFQVPRPGFPFVLRICVTELAGLNEPVVNLVMTIPNYLLGNLQVVNTAGAAIQGNQLIWQILNLGALQSICFDVEFQVLPSTPLGQHLSLSIIGALSTGVIDINTDNNTIRWQTQVVASYDPNDKTADRHTLPYQGTQERSVLDYTVRFQNIGTAPAIFVEVYDTLSTQLDLRTLEMVDASHNYELTFPADNVLKWRFDDINLPDSASNPLGSQGFVRFRIAAHEGLPLYDEVKNAVSIYFDFNDPVFTDTSLATVCPEMNLSTFASHAKCGKENGIAVVSHAPGNFTYLWSTGSTISKISNLAPGLYTVTVFSSIAACDEIAVVEIEEIPTPQLELMELQNITCFGQANGHLEVGSATGLLPFSYLWNTGDTSAQIAALAPGTYSVILKDKNNCRDTLELLSISQPDSLAISGQVIHQTSLQNPDGSISVFTQGGTAPYTFAWSNSDTAAQLINLTASTYTVTVTDAHGCAQTAEFEVQYTVGTSAVLKQAFSVQPNPTSADITIRLPETLHCSSKIWIHLYNEQGKRCLEKWIPENTVLTNLAVNTLPPGVYRLCVSRMDLLPHSEAQN